MNHLQANANDSREALDIYIRMLASKSGARVFFGERREPVNPFNVYIPSVPESIDAISQALFLTDVEIACAKCRHFDFELRKNLRQREPQVFSIFKQIEQAWIERQAILDRPHIRDRVLEASQALIDDNQLETGEESRECAFLAAVLYSAHIALGRGELQEVYEQARTHLDNFWGDAGSDIQEAVFDMLTKHIVSNSGSEDNAFIARQIYQMLRDYVQLLGVDVSALAGRSCLQVQGDIGYLASVTKYDGYEVDIAHLDVDTRKTLGQAIHYTLHTLREMNVMDYTSPFEIEQEEDALSLPVRSDAHGEEGMEGGNGYCESGFYIGRPSYGQYQSDFRYIEAETKHLAYHLKRVLQERAVCESRAGYIGSNVKRSKIYRLGYKDTRILTRKRYMDNGTAAFGLLIDISSSTRGVCDMAMRQSAIMFSVALDELDVPHAVWGFGSDGSKQLITIVKNFEEPHRESMARFGSLYYEAGGGTPLLESLESVGPLIAVRPESRKMLIVVTDGMPANKPACVTTVRELEQLGCHVVHLVFSVNSESQRSGWLTEAGLPAIDFSTPMVLPGLIGNELERFI